MPELFKASVRYPKVNKTKNPPITDTDRLDELERQVHEKKQILMHDSRPIAGVLGMSLTLPSGQRRDLRECLDLFVKTRRAAEQEARS